MLRLAMLSLAMLRLAYLVSQEFRSQLTSSLFTPPDIKVLWWSRMRVGFAYRQTGRALKTLHSWQ